jgi:hypothetical protein
MGSYKTLTLLLSALSLASASPPTVALDTGIWTGVPTQLPGSSITVHKYLGLPFAAPPIRFSPPQLPAKSTALRAADTLSPACIQNGGGNFTTKEQPESEDCLYLNVFAPAPSSNASTADRKTVMVWFFGGGLQFGTASLPGYDGTSFATNQDVILVAPNYRTNGQSKTQAQPSQSSKLNPPPSLRLPRYLAPPQTTQPGFPRPTHGPFLGATKHRPLRRRSKKSNHLR